MSEPESDHQELPAGISQGTALENERCLYSDRRAWKNAHPLQNDETVGTNAGQDPDEHNRYHGDLFEKQPRAAGHQGLALAFPLLTRPEHRAIHRTRSFFESWRDRVNRN